MTSGYQVDIAVNGDDGLSRGRSGDYAVMTIDRMLPGIDGIAVIRRLREDGHPIGKEGRLLMATGGGALGLRATIVFQLE